MAELTIFHRDAAGMRAQKAILLDAYVEIYAAKLGDPFFVPERFWERLEAYASRDGFDLVVGYSGEVLVGYALGFRLPAKSAWWRGFHGDVSPDVLTETGDRTFALTQIMVRPAWRRQGCARQLHDALVVGRPEERATLLVQAENVAARRAYAAWGWEQIGTVKPFEDSPTYDALVLPLELAGKPAGVHLADREQG
jgi:ribosomal protein S18 acetylase RimI-like enzyme